ncbi:alpha/beta hydrolase fold domain-containing protein [Limnobacter sp. MED105]|uniref:alpha/beta hydrolase fold domain-containing protein n=1 Tax=Limnobacter sp. MED105 TaxID=391597 RepID=UPI001E579059|nr:alpha/beta hydrolase [Limnobacter sp. MED105]
MSSMSKSVTLFLRLCQGRLLAARNPEKVWRVGERVTNLLQKLSRMPAGCTVQHRTVNGVPVEIIENHSAHANTSQTLLFLHGGGFAFGSAANYRAFVARLCKKSGIARAWVPDYTLMGKAPFPAGLNDVVEVWKALLQEHGQNELLLAGDSAGGNLSLALCHAMNASELRLPSRVYLSSPWLDPSLGESDLRPEVVDAFLGHNEAKARDWLKRMFATPYASVHDPENPLISPLLGDLSRLPPVYVQCSANEVFMVDSLRLMKQAQALGTECYVDVWSGVFHDFILFSPTMPEGRAAFAAASAWLGHGEVRRPPCFQNRIRQLSSPL